MAGVFALDIPRFDISDLDKSIEYGYTDPVKKENLLIALKDVSSDYCMYCYRKTSNDGDNTGHLEHAIEKSNSFFLIECVPDLGLACPKCNLSYKRRGEAKRKLVQSDIDSFEAYCECNGETKQCLRPCDAYVSLKHKYVNRKDGHIILQPQGVELREGIPLIIQYDVLNARFRPASTVHSYNAEELEFIEDHIKQFSLNDPVRRTRSLFNYVQDVVNCETCLPWERYDNYIVKLFAEELNKYDPDERIKICDNVFRILFPKMK